MGRDGELVVVTGHCRVEGSPGTAGESGVLYQPLAPSLDGLSRVSSLQAFLGADESASPRFVTLTPPDKTCLRQYLPHLVLTDELLSTILASYDEPWRFFHDRNHLHAMFEQAAVHEVRLSLEQSFAVLFHDLVYVPGAASGHNEKQSIQLMKYYQQRIQRDDLDWALTAQIIEDTASHNASRPESEAVLDLDLSVLAGSSLQFRAANELVWLENRHLLAGGNPRKDFDTNRLKFLLNLAERASIFVGPLLGREDAARENLESLRQAWVKQYAVG